jgi:gas vesicle protein
MMSRDFRTGSIVPFVFGAGVGAVVALLLAPKTGKDLRSDIGEGVNAGAERIGVISKELKQHTGKVVAQVQDVVQDAVEAGQNAYNEA